MHSTGFGVVSVNGRILSPRPAARIIATRAVMHSRDSSCAEHCLRSEKCRVDALRQEFRKLGSFRVSRRGGPRVVEDPRQILEIAGLAVAIIEARKNAEYLDVPLQSHEVEPTNEGRC